MTMALLWQDFRFGIRMLMKHPTLSIIAILTFGLGVGLTTTVFSVVNGALFKGLPFEEADRVMALLNSNLSNNIRRMPVSVHDFVIWQERQTVFESFGAWSITAINLVWGEGRPERYSAGTFSTGVLEVLRVTPVLGYLSGAVHEGSDPYSVMVLYSIRHVLYGIRLHRIVPGCCGPLRRDVLRGIPANQGDGNSHGFGSPGHATGAPHDEKRRVPVGAGSRDRLCPRSAGCGSASGHLIQGGISRSHRAGYGSVLPGRSRIAGKPSAGSSCNENQSSGGPDSRVAADPAIPSYTDSG